MGAFLDAVFLAPVFLLRGAGLARGMVAARVCYRFARDAAAAAGVRHGWGAGRARPLPVLSLAAIPPRHTASARAAGWMGRVMEREGG